MNAGTILVLIGTIFAAVSLIDTIPGVILALAVLLIGIGILVGVSPLSLR